MENLSKTMLQAKDCSSKMNESSNCIFIEGIKRLGVNCKPNVSSARTCSTHRHHFVKDFVKKFIGRRKNPLGRHVFCLTNCMHWTIWSTNVWTKLVDIQCFQSMVVARGVMLYLFDRILIWWWVVGIGA